MHKKKKKKKRKVIQFPLRCIPSSRRARAEKMLWETLSIQTKTALSLAHPKMTPLHQLPAELCAVRQDSRCLILSENGE